MLGSEKVPWSATGGRFVFAGLYGSDGSPIALENERLQLLATSLALPDPWSAQAAPDWSPVVEVQVFPSFNCFYQVLAAVFSVPKL